MNGGICQRLTRLSVDPMDIVISAGRKGRNKKAPRDGVQK